VKSWDVVGMEKLGPVTQNCAQNQGIIKEFQEAFVKTVSKRDLIAGTIEKQRNAIKPREHSMLVLKVQPIHPAARQ